MIPNVEERIAFLMLTQNDIFVRLRVKVMRKYVKREMVLICVTKRDNNNNARVIT